MEFDFKNYSLKIGGRVCLEKSEFGNQSFTFNEHLKTFVRGCALSSATLGRPQGDEFGGFVCNYS